jgi:maleylpyruvate isomerase
MNDGDPTREQMSKQFELHSFFRSGTSHRVRIALNLKGLTYEYRPINLRAGEHVQAAYKSLNPQGLVPTLVADGHALTQSPAIIEWLEEKFPSPPLLPRDSHGRAVVRAMAAIIGCDTHPLNNLRVLNYLRRQFARSDEEVSAWCQTWVLDGLRAFEALALGYSKDKFSFGGTPTIADIYLIPQLASARRFGVDLAVFGRLLDIESAAAELKPFRDAAPDLQPDAAAP